MPVAGAVALGNSLAERSLIYVRRRDIFEDCFMDNFCFYMMQFNCAVYALLNCWCQSHSTLKLLSD